MLMASALAMLIAGLSAEEKSALAFNVRVEAAKACAAQGNILGWGAATMPQKFTLPFCELHHYLVEHRADALSALKAPRWHSKTTVGCTLIPLYQMLNEPKGFDFYLWVEANDSKAMAVNRAIKSELESNDILRYIYGNQVGPRWSDGEFELKNGVVSKAIGAGVSSRGIQYNNRRPNYVRVDDLYDEEDIASLDATKKKTDWFKSTVYNMIAQDRPASLGVLGTAINSADILTEMETWEGCTSKTFAALDKDNKALWPELYDAKKLERIREHLGTIIFNRELMNICQDDAEAIIKSAWLAGWEYDPDIKWARRPDEGVKIAGALLGCDPSTGEKEVGDPAGYCVAIVTSGPGSRKDYWIEALENKVMSWDERLAQLERMKSFQNARSAEYHLRRAFIEAIGGFKDFGNQAKVKTGLPIEVVSWVKGKKANLAAKSGHFEFGKVHLSNKISKPLRDTLVSQLIQNDPEHDDLRDAVLLVLEDPTLNMKAWVTG